MQATLKILNPERANAPGSAIFSMRTTRVGVARQRRGNLTQKEHYLQTRSASMQGWNLKACSYELFKDPVQPVWRANLLHTGY